MTAMQAQLPSEWLSPKEYAARIGVCAKTVYRAIKAGQLAARRIGRQLRVEWTPLDKSPAAHCKPDERG